MLRWWSAAGIERADLAVRRADGAMLWHADQALDALPLAWARAQNVQRADVYVRPARGHRWPLVFLDDVACHVAAAVARDHAALVIRTSPAGGCHVWLRCTRPLDEEQRRDVQRQLVHRLAADPASISGEHLGRLAGFKNWKRAGVWVNVLHASQHRAWVPAPTLAESMLQAPRRHSTPTTSGRDTSPSGADWAFTCRLLEAGCEPSRVLTRLIERARPRRGSDAHRYAARTLRQALEHVARRTTRDHPT
jgi:hypothetical protein